MRPISPFNLKRDEVIPVWMFMVYLAVCVVFYFILYRLAEIEPPLPDPYRDTRQEDEN